VWHDGASCGAYRAATEATDALAALAKARRWKACPGPGCGALIDKAVGDCNFVRHDACGTGFCFHCGRAYVDGTPTPRNAHGTPACGCGLWNYADEADDNDGDDDDAGVVGDGPRGGGRAAAAPLEMVALVDGAAAAAAAAALGGGGGGGGGARRAPPGAPLPLGVPVRLPRAGVPLDLDDLLDAAANGERRLPNGIVHDLEMRTCSYPACRREFVSLAALAAHLRATTQHDVFVCCGRPFVSLDGLAQHQRDSAPAHHEYSCYERGEADGAVAAY